MTRIENSALAQLTSLISPHPLFFGKRGDFHIRVVAFISCLFLNSYRQLAGTYFDRIVPRLPELDVPAVEDELHAQVIEPEEGG